MLGEAYEGEINVVRSKPMNEVAKARMVEEFTKKASDAYSKILTRYPVMDRVEDARSVSQPCIVRFPRPRRCNRTKHG